MEHEGRKRVGLALGGGVARGLAHVGVMAALLEAGIPIDYVAGTSAGSIVGATFSAGMSIQEIITFAESLHWWDIASLIWPKRGFLSFMKLERRLARQLGDLTFADLKIPFAAVATDMDTGNPVVFQNGRVAPAVRASCSVPGIIEPAEIDGLTLGDGSLADSVPVDVLYGMGAEYVIGVDIFCSSIYPRLGPFGIGFTAMEILVQRAGGGIEKADCLIRPDLAGNSYIRFSRRESYFELGRQAALEKVDSIKKEVYNVEFLVRPPTADGRPL